MNPIPSRLKPWALAGALAAAAAAAPATAASVAYADADVAVAYSDDDEGWYEVDDGDVYADSYDTTVVYENYSPVSVAYVSSWNAPYYVHHHYRGCAHWRPAAAWHGYSRGRAYVRGYDRGYHTGRREERREDRRDNGRDSHHEHRHGR